MREHMMEQQGSHQASSRGSVHDEPQQISSEAGEERCVFRWLFLAHLVRAVEGCGKSGAGVGGLEFFRHYALRTQIAALICRESEETDVDEFGDIHIGEIGERGWSWREFRKFLGAAWLVSIAYLDPGNLETDLQSGAQYGYKLGWVLLWSSVLGILVQILSLRLGIVSQRNLAQMCRDEYPVQLRWILWFFAELMIVASDVPEVGSWPKCATVGNACTHAPLECTKR